MVFIIYSRNHEVKTSVFRAMEIWHFRRMSSFLLLLYSLLLFVVCPLIREKLLLQ